MSEDTRQDPSSLPALNNDAADDLEYSSNTIEDTVVSVRELIDIRTSVECYRDQLKAAGQDGLDPVAKQLMAINLQQLKARPKSYGLESFDAEQEVTLEDFSEWLGNLGERIKQLIDKFIKYAKEYAARIMTGVEKVKTQAEELIERAKGRSKNKASNELHDEGQVINLGSVAILFADGEFCLSDHRAEKEVIKFFDASWPRYAKDQITRAKKMIAEYDVESGNSENFEANIGFLGNHTSFTNSVTAVVLPGNKQVGFKYGALGPELVNAEGAKEAPSEYSFTTRSSAEVNNTLKQNVVMLNALSGLFKADSSVLNEMATLSEALLGLENRRGETVWKSAREGLDDISKAMMELINKLKPNYDPIVRHLTTVANARNAVCRKELDALGQ